MSTLRYDYDDANGERNIEVEIDYEFRGGYEERVEGRAYWVRGEIDLRSVRVEAVSYYNPDGDVMTRIKRADMSQPATVALDAEAYNDVQAEVDKWGYLADQLMDNAE